MESLKYLDKLLHAQNMRIEIWKIFFFLERIPIISPPVQSVCRIFGIGTY